MGILSSICPSHSDIREEPILKLLETAQNVEHQRKILHQLYISWNKNTWKTIRTLLAIRDELKEHSFNSNCAIVFGSVVTVLGSIVDVAGSIAGSLLKIPELSLASTIGGTAAATAGRVISSGSHITFNYLSKKLCIEAKKVFELNLKCTEDVERSRSTYFKFLEEFKDQLYNLELKYHQMMISVLEEENLVHSLKDLHLSRCQVNQSNMSPTVSKMKKLRQNFVIGKKKNDLKKYFIELISVINKDPIMKKMIQDHTPKDLHGLILPIVDATSAKIQRELLIEIVSWISKAGENLQFLFREMSTVVKVSLGILNTIFLAWGMTDLVNTSINIHNGSDTDQIREIGQVAEKLQKIRQEVIRINREIFEWDLKFED